MRAEALMKPMIEIRDIKKQYVLGEFGSGELANDLKTWWAKIRNKPIENTLIGEFGPNKNSFMALDGVSFSVYQGEALGIIGGNGAGKSTLLKLISRVTAPTAGEIVLRGRVASMLEVGTGFNGEMTGRENIYMNGAILGMTKAEIDSKLENIIEFSECRDFIDTPVKRYSSGMYVKLAFAVASHLDSEIMIMDEVLAVGDAKFQKKCLGKMGESSHDENKTILYVSHNIATIRQLCTRCVVLDKGKLIHDGDVEEAIRIYSEANAAQSTSLSFPLLPEYESTRSAVFTKIAITNAVDGLVQNQTRLHIIAEIMSFKDFSKTTFWGTVKTSTEYPIGMFFSRNFALKQGKICSISMHVDSSMLVSGNYILDFHIGLFENGCRTSYDHHKDMLGFEVIENSKQREIQWYPSMWGHTVIEMEEFETTEP